MANNQLITGAGVAANKFVDAAAEINKGFSAATQSVRGFNRPNTVTKNQEYQNRVNSLMGKMKTDMDFTSFSPAETASMRTFLVNERQKYADAAKAVANMTDATSPEYMVQVDIMNGVNNSFTNLAGQLKSYKKGKAEYAEGMMSGTYSDGNELENSKVNSTMYGFIDEDGDGKSDSRLNAPFSIMQGGNIGFNIEGETVPYNDTTPPLLKDYELGVGLLKQNEEVRKSGRLVGADAEKMYRLQLQTAFANQDSLRSFIYDFEDEFPTEDLGKLWEENPNNGDVINQIRGQVIDRLVNSRIEAGKTGYSQRKSSAKPSASGYTDLAANDPKGDGRAGRYKIWSYGPGTEVKYQYISASVDGNDPSASYSDDDSGIDPEQIRLPVAAEKKELKKRMDLVRTSKSNADPAWTEGQIEAEARRLMHEDRKEANSN
jgi:hypothetical protein